MDNSLHLTNDICEIPEILQEYFSPEELFEIFQLDKLGEERNNDNEIKKRKS